MKKPLIILLFLISFSGYAQYGNFGNSVGVSAGYVEDGLGIMFTYNNHLSRRSYVQVSILGTASEDKAKGIYKIPYNIFTIQPGYFYRFYESSVRRNFAAFVGGGALLGYEIINNGDKVLENGAEINARSQFLYGAFVGVEAEYVLSDSFSILGKVNQYYHANSDVGKLFPYAGIGIRYFMY